MDWQNQSIMHETIRRFLRAEEPLGGTPFLDRMRAFSGLGPVDSPRVHPYYPPRTMPEQRRHPGTIYGRSPVSHAAFASAAAQVAAFTAAEILAQGVAAGQSPAVAAFELIDIDQPNWSDFNLTRAAPQQGPNQQPANQQPVNQQPDNQQPANQQPANLQPGNLPPANLQSANLQSTPAELYQIDVDVQYYSAEELTVKVFDRFIIVKGRHNQRPEKYCWAARQFVKKYKIPSNVDIDQIKCQMSADNFLTITAPIKPAPGLRDIIIHREPVGPMPAAPAQAPSAAQVKTESPGNENAEATSSTDNRDTDAPPTDNANAIGADAVIPPNDNPA